MDRMYIQAGLVACAIFVAGATAAPGQADTATPRQREEFTRLVQQRNELHAQLHMLAAESAVQGPRSTVAGETRLVQNRLDIVEQQMADLSASHGLTIPRRPVSAVRTGWTGGTTSAAASQRSSTLLNVQPTPKERAGFKKLVIQRNKLYSRLAKLDDRAAELVKQGQKPLVVYAEQVSAQDQLDLVELRLAILSTRHGIPIPLVPGRVPGPGGTLIRPDDDVNRNLEKAFARGRERTVTKLRTEADSFLGSLDFREFLNE